MSEVDDLRAQLAELTRQRAATLTHAENIIRTANENYDRAALAINRRIQELDPTPRCPYCGYQYGHRAPMSEMCQRLEGKPATQPARRPRKRLSINIEGMADWTEEERQHFRELAGRR